MPTLALGQVRDRVGVILAPVVETDPPVYPELVDAIVPPALILEWADPWLAQQMIAGKLAPMYAMLNVFCLAPRVEPSYAALEVIVARVLALFQADPYPWNLTGAQSPRRFDIAAVPTLGSRLTFQIPVYVGGT